MEKSKNAKVSGIITTKGRTFKVNLFVIQFEDNGCQVAYCPALNIYGYGKSETEARSSFEIHMSEFFDYTIKKKTLIKELESLGWSIKKEKRFTAPLFSKLLEKNRDLRKIMDTKNFTKVSEPIRLPAIA